MINSNIKILQKTLSSPKKSPCGKMHTRQKVFKRFLMILKDYCDFRRSFSDFKGFLWILNNSKITIFQMTLFSSKKRPLRENAHTAKYFYAFFSKKKGPCGKMQTRQKMFYGFFLFFCPGEEFLCITNVHT